MTHTLDSLDWNLYRRHDYTIKLVELYEFYCSKYNYNRTTKAFVYLNMIQNTYPITSRQVASAILINACMLKD